MITPTPSGDIAIIGMSCRVAGADSPSKLWEILASSKDVRKEITRFNSAGYYKATGGSRKGLTNVRHAYLLEEGIDRFDNGFFATPAVEAEAMDPQQRLLLEIAYEAMENAGIPLEKIQGTDTAVYAGLFTNDYGTSLLRDIDTTPKYHSTGTSNSIAANRISYFFDLHGPSLVIDTACSSTLTALNQAVNVLKSGESGMALVCGANLILNPDMFVHMSELGFLSPDGRCKSFDASGDGYARGEGVLALLLKPLAQALQNNDPIRSVIKGTRVNQDGKTNGITMPSPEAQRLNMQALYTTHGLHPGDVQYLEAHGTGTKVGDPLEMSAIDSIFSDSHTEQPLIVGSIKSNVGHLEACAAIVGIVKTIECLERGKIPAQKHFINPNPKINFANKMVPRTLMDWPKTNSGVRRAAINSFGFGGTNGHAVLENFPSGFTTHRKFNRPFLFKVSAANELSLQHLCLAYADYVGKVRPPLDRLAYTLLSRRSTLKKSLFIIASNHEELIENLVSWQRGPSQVRSFGSLLTHSIGFVFTGQGAQWAEMGRQLLENSATFARVIDVCEQELSLLQDRPGWSIRQELCKPAKTSRINISSFSQPLCTALQLGIVELFKEWGIIPKAVLGHSSGEIGAAYTAGMLSLRDAIVTAYYRGLYMSSQDNGQNLQSRGAMCAIGLGASAAQSLLGSYSGRVSLAAVNSPSSCTLSGDKSPIDEIVEHCKEQGIFCRALRVDTAYHSHHMLPLAPLYQASLNAAGISSAVSPSQSGCEMFSSVIQRKLAPRDCTSAYWVQNMVSTVRFTAALTEATKCHSLGALVEIGPHPALKGPTLDTLAATGKSEIAYLSSCIRNKPDLIALLETTASMVNVGFPMSTEAVNKVDFDDGKAIEYTPGPPLTDIPKYHWDHSASYWAESRISKNQRFRQFPRHPLLGARSSDDIPSSPIWRNLLRRKEVDWLDAMMHGGLTSLPKSSYILMALEAARQTVASLKLDVFKVIITDMCFVNDISLLNLQNDDGFIETQFRLWPDQKQQKYQFSVSAQPDGDQGDWCQYCSGFLSFASEHTQDSALPEVSGNDPAILEYIQSLAIYPKADFESLRLDSERANGSFSNIVGNDDDEDDENYHINPAIFAALERLPDMLFSGSGLPAEYKVGSINSIRASLSQKRTSKAEFRVRAKRVSPIQGVSELQIRDASGCFLCLEGMSSKVVRSIERKHPLKSLFFKPDIRPDISCIKSTVAMSLHDVIELVTHKWPMADFGAADISEGDLDCLKSYLKGIREHERPRFRSLSVFNREGFPSVDRLRAFKAFDSDQRFHFFLSTARDLPSRISCVRSDGFACLMVEKDGDRDLFANHLDLICNIEGLSHGQWLLGRPKLPQNGSPEPHKLVIFASDQCDITMLYEYGTFQVIQISQDTTATVRSIQQHLPEAADIIIMDCAQESILATWSGGELLPWIQPVLERAQNLLWVSNQINSNPFAGLTGAFIRTVQSEYPSLKASSLNFKDSSFVAKTVFEVYESMSHGNDELEILVQSGHVCALRYRPDDELSAAVGCIPPHKSDRGLGSSEYEITMAEPGRATLLSSRRTGIDLSDDYVQVATDVSLVDFEDVKIFDGIPLNGTEFVGLGQFFAGKVVSSSTHSLEPGRCVVGWQPGAHRSTVFAPSSQVSPIPANMSLDRAVVHFAAYVVAFTIICDVARARRFETMNIDVSGILGEALTNVCKFLEIKVIGNSQKYPAFVVNSDSVRGLQVNRQDFAMRSFDALGQAHNHLNRMLWDQPTLLSHHDVFELWDFQKAFENAKANPLSTVLKHYRSESVQGDLLSYCSSEKLFKHDAAYVVVGGLGGLGRYTLKWMVSKGARHLVTLSRSGLDSKEAQLAAEEIQQLGAEILALKLDASDESGLRSALARVREKRPIRGCINMVLILDNSPLNTMTNQQWDKVISSKVRTTWNLHQATLCDSLDMFLMFSSVSSISGNRTQANYATGNAFQNAVAEYRRKQDLPGIAIALGAMRSIGVLAEDHALLRTLSQSGLLALGPKELCKILEAAIIESKHADRYLLSTGFEMFETLDGAVQSRPDQTQLFWTEWPEFGFLLEHNFSTAETTKAISLSEQIKTQSPEAAHVTLVQAFVVCLGNILGYDTASIDPSSSLASYGLDSLNAVSCRYWFFKELKLDVPIFDVLGCKSINELISRVLHKLDGISGVANTVSLPKPVPHEQQTLTRRPISHSQSRLWFLHRFLPDKTVHNLLLVCHISGKINVPAFAESWSVFIGRHEILHSKIIDTESGLQQIPSNKPHFELTLINSIEDPLESQVASIVETARSWVFDLESGELVRGWLLESEVGCRFFLASHHLAWDRASVPTIFHETTSIYKSLTNGKPAETGLAPPKYQFIDYTLWQNEWMARPEIVRPHIDYWKAQLAGVPDSVSLLPTALSPERPKQKQFEVEIATMTLDSTITAQLKEFCRTMAVTPFMFMASVLTALIYRFTGDDDIVIGIADGDRGHTEFDRLVGFTVNMLAIRSKITGDSPFTYLLEDYRKTCLEAYEHRAIPFDYLLQNLKIPRRTSHSPLFQVSINYQMQGAFAECDFGDFKFTDYDHYNARSQSDFMMDIEETLKGELHCALNFDTKLYDMPAMSSFANSFKIFVGNVLKSKGEAQLDSVSLVSEEDRHFISSKLQPDFKQAQTLQDLDRDLFPDLLNRAVASHPRKAAIIDDANILTYAELDIATRRIAAFLVDEGAQAGDRIGVCCEQGADMVLAMCGIVRASCVYVPIDPDFPQERMSSMIQDVDMHTVLVDSFGDKKYERLITCGIRSSRCYLINKLCRSVEHTDLPLVEDFGQLSFCCIFTSGSTGRPKGIAIGHRQLRYQMEGYHSYINTTSDDRMLWSSAMVFDMSLPPLFGTFLHGGTMVIASREARYSPAAMVDLLVEREVSSCTFTTTQLKMLLTAPNKGKLAKWTSLRSMVIGGEAIPPWVVRDFFNLNLPNASIFNGYAPAETTVCNSLRRLVPEDVLRSDIPLGKPIFPSRFHILDKHLNPIPIGLQGELYIGGPTVNEGYIKRKELTAEAFLADPFASVAEIEAGHGRLYRTKDSFRLMPDGSIVSVGRIGGDRQIKIRGMRTELDEIETAIYDACQAIEDEDMCQVTLAAVVYHLTSGLDGVLAAYIEAPQSNKAQQQSLTSYLRLRLKASLPVHMNPSAVVFVNSLPRTVSEKINYKEIHTWPTPVPQAISSLNQDTTGRTLNSLQANINVIWKSVLNIERDLSLADEFFALGGHSLTLIHVQEGIREKCNVTIQLADMFANPTIEGMERLVTAELLNGTTDIPHDIFTNGVHTPVSKGSRTLVENIDWVKETCLPPEFDCYVQPTFKKLISAVAMTGARTMAGAHFIHHVLRTTDLQVYCLGTEGADNQEARANVLASLTHWRLHKDLLSQHLNRLTVFSGSLSHPTLGLPPHEVDRLDESVDAIFQLDSDVSLLKRYESLRDSNVGSLRFLISLARGRFNNTKPIHYLSTWGVPHLQAWHGSQLSTPQWLTSEVEMTNMTPSKDGSLGYLKARWACEALLYKAARRGIPVNIFRSCMCASSPLSGVPLDRTDINRRILEGSLQVGMIPNFGSDAGGGMSWITADFLVQSMFFLSQRHVDPIPKARIHHIVSDVHIPYTEMADVLGLSRSGEKMKTARPEEWFAALRQRGNNEMTMQAEVLEKWCQAGWIPFGLEAKSTLEVLREEIGLTPPRISGDLLSRLVVGDQGF